MKSLKKVILAGAFTGIAFFAMTICSKAATAQVTAETLNVRKGPSTDTEIIAMLSEGVECEILEEDGDWYKVKYKNYTGYVSKDYVKIIGSSSNNENENTQSNSQQNNDSENSNSENNNSEQNTNEENSQSSELEQNNNSQENNNEDEVTITYKKFTKDTDVKLLPLIHSSKIESMKSGTRVIFITEASGWSYIQTDSISGWVRSDTLSEDAVVSGSSLQNNKEKTAYVNESRVNLRTGAGTNNSIIKVVTLNTEVTIIEEDGDWCKVKAGSDTGYILKEYLSSSKIVTSRSNTVSRTEETENANIITTKQENTSTSNKTNSTAKANITSNTENKSNTSETSKKSSATNSKKTNTKTKSTDIVAYAQKYLGYKYVYGGNGSNNTFDCSGFTMYVFKHFGISLPHSASAQYNSGKGKKIKEQSDLQVGDIVFLTDYETGKGIGHCGIYLGNGNFIHASTTTYTVTISSLNKMYKGRFYAGLRLI